MRHDVSLNDRYDLSKTSVLLNGTQALVRLTLMQAARDRVAGLNTAGFVTGYRGSPLGAVDFQMQRASGSLTDANIKFQEGLNEDLAATALWGSQQAELRGEGKFDGVFGLWYGKGPGVDRSGDVFRHANMAGTSPHGGVVAALGDDHTGESSTTLHQSELTMMDSFMPVLSPAGVQEVMDYGLFGYALSRYAGVWAGLKCMKDTIEVTSVVDGDPHRLSFVPPEFDMPDGGLSIRLIDTPQDQEHRIINYKQHAVRAFAHANGMDQRIWGKPGAKIGFVAAGKNWLDLTHALTLLGYDEQRAKAHGVTTYKVAMTWPLDTKSFDDWADGLDAIVVVEEKRKLIEGQIKEYLFGRSVRPRVFGGNDSNGNVLLPSFSALDPVLVAEKLGKFLQDEGHDGDQLRGAMAQLQNARQANNAPTLVTRLPYFCSGCPHNSSTKLPDDARAYAGIGCHYMVQWMDRETLGFTQMGGEGANWIGEAPFSTRPHIFQNIGDGTYNHSGLQAIRAAVVSNTTMTYKILFNDAVAMTGGQTNDGGLQAAQIASEVQAFGVQNLALVYDEKEDLDLTMFPPGILVRRRSQLMDIQNKFSKTNGVSVIVYVQTCAAEKRRRRKRGQFPDPATRLFINPDVCEGCGDCGVQSNCVSIVPLETPFGRKRRIDQSSCNKDYSCINGFCPSFVTVNGGTLRKSQGVEVDVTDLAQPKLPEISGSHNVIITGIGGTGVVTLGAVLAMAAHLDGKASGMMEMAGLAQKGGAVHIHCRIANDPKDISAIRVALGECDTLIGGDLVVSAQGSTLGLLAPNAKAVVNTHQTITGDFTRDTKFTIPGTELELGLSARVKSGLRLFDATALAEQTLGDTVYANMVLLGAAYQLGQIPLTGDGIHRAIELNGAKVDQNQKAFDVGRLAANQATWPVPDAVKTMPISEEDMRREHLSAYGGDHLVKYDAIAAQFAGSPLATEICKSYHKVLTYKDEYEVARLLLKSKAQVAEVFEGDVTLNFNLAPPLIARKGANGRPTKMQFGQWFLRLARPLAALKFLRGTVFDPFGYTAERRVERRLIRQYEALLKRFAGEYYPDDHDIWTELLMQPQTIVGFGPVKEANAKAADLRKAELLQALNRAKIAA